MEEKKKWMKKLWKKYGSSIKDVYAIHFGKEIIKLEEKWRQDYPVDLSKYSCPVVDISVYYKEGETKIYMEESYPSCCKIYFYVVVETNIQHPKANQIVEKIHQVEALSNKCDNSEKCKCYFCVLEMVKKWTNEE